MCAKQGFLAGVLCCAISAHASDSRYVLRLEHSSFAGHSCALLETNGTFHLEVDGNDVKVFEGSIPAAAVADLEADVNSEALVNLTQARIEEPLISTRRDELQLTVLRGGDWQDLFFRSSDSQKPYQRWLQPLTHWLDNLHKLPHRELSEDEGKNNCLPPKPITLKKRDADSLSAPVTSKTTTRILSIGPATAQPQLQSAPPLKPQSFPALLRVYSLEIQTGGAHEHCVLLGENGTYRSEDRMQKTGKPVTTKITAGQIKPDALEELHKFLDAPTLAKIKHHEPAGGMVVPMMGDIMDITIFRPSGVQHFILSSRFNHAGFEPFYSGDADSSVARPLLTFLGEHIENNPARTLDPSKRNGCSEAP